MRAGAAVLQFGWSIGATTLISIPMLVSADPTLTAVLSHTASFAVACALVAVAGATYLAQRDVAPPAALAPALLASFVASSLVYALRLDVTISIAGDALGWVSRLVAWMSLAALGPLWVFPAGGGAEGLRASRLAFLEMAGLLILFTLGVAAHVRMAAGPVDEGTLDQGGRLGSVVAAFVLVMSWLCLSRPLARLRLVPDASQDGTQSDDVKAWDRIRAIERLDGAERLTGRERSVLGLLSEGGTQVQVAGQLGISPSTVSTYRARALRKLGLPADCDLRHLGTKDAAPVVHPAVRVSRVAPLGGFLLPLACILLGAPLEGLSLSQGWDAGHVEMRLTLSWVVMLWLALRLWVPRELGLDALMGARVLAVASACCLGLLVGPMAATEQGVSLRFLATQPQHELPPAASLLHRPACCGTRAFVQGAFLRCAPRASGGGGLSALPPRPGAQRVAGKSRFGACPGSEPKGRQSEASRSLGYGELVQLRRVSPSWRPLEGRACQALVQRRRLQGGWT